MRGRGEDDFRDSGSAVQVARDVQELRSCVPLPKE